MLSSSKAADACKSVSRTETITVGRVIGDYILSSIQVACSVKGGRRLLMLKGLKSAEAKKSERKRICRQTIARREVPTTTARSWRFLQPHEIQLRSSKLRIFDRANEQLTTSLSKPRQKTSNTDKNGSSSFQRKGYRIQRPPLLSRPPSMAQDHSRAGR